MSPEYGSGNGTIRVYIVEARTSYSTPEQHAGMILDGTWRRVSFPKASIGVQNLLLYPDAVHHGFLNYEAAMALAHWFMAEPGITTGFPFPALCVETRIVQIEYKWEYSTKEIGVGPTMGMTATLRATKFESRNTEI